MKKNILDQGKQIENEKGNVIVEQKYSLEIAENNNTSENLSATKRKGLRQSEGMKKGNGIKAIQEKSVNKKDRQCSKKIMVLKLIL